MWLDLRVSVDHRRCVQGPYEEEIIEAVADCLWSREAQELGDEFEESINAVQTAVLAQQRLRAEAFPSSETVITGLLTAATPATPIPSGTGGLSGLPPPSHAPSAAAAAAAAATATAAVYGLRTRLTSSVLGIGGELTLGTSAGWATDADIECRLHPDVVSARRATVVEMLLRLQDRLSRVVHVGHVLLGLGPLVGATGASSHWADHRSGRRSARNCVDAILDLLSISSLVYRRPMLAEGCYNILFSIVKDKRLSTHVFDTAQVR